MPGMDDFIIKFQDIRSGSWTNVGGKGANLSRMYRSGFPVPEGFVVLPGAFCGNELKREAWDEILTGLAYIRKNHKNAFFAVRSSAASEDSSLTSFAGGYESVLNVSADKDISKAILTVYRSGASERIRAYRAAHGIENECEMAVVVQLMVKSEISGVLFTVDPVTGSHAKMIGDLVFGLGEKLVSGTADAQSFSFTVPKGRYEGPKELIKYASQLYRYARKLEADLGWPQDIEWAAAKGKLYLLQTRPITNIQPGNPETYEWNDTLDGDYIWTNTNIGEANPDVMTPLTWSKARYLDNEQSYHLPGFYKCSGNICGRIYTNISLLLSIMAFFGIDARKGVEMIRDGFGDIPTHMSIPIYPYTLSGIIKKVLPKIIRTKWNSSKLTRNSSRSLRDNPDWCIHMAEKIRGMKTKEGLAALWKNEVKPYMVKSWQMVIKYSRKNSIAITLNKKLLQLTGTDAFYSLLYETQMDSGLSSLDPIIGIVKIIKGELNREEYIKRYGHRGPHEIELSLPDPNEDPGWPDILISDFKSSGADVDDLFKQKRIQHEELWKRFSKLYPHKVKWLKKKIRKASSNSLKREASRSEFVRVNRVIRAFALKTGELTGIGEDIFFIYMNEMERLLNGDAGVLKNIPARKATYRKYSALPPLPSVIRGRFDPYQWVKDPNSRNDYYDSTIPAISAGAKTLKGFAGSPGQVKGIVRVIANMEEGYKLHAGEILAAATTNVGWTPLFPRAAAVITDIGAPLSHAAIVARELGIPAVVGCGNATHLLKTGDLVMVDGASGIVQILDQAKA